MKKWVWITGITGAAVAVIAGAVALWPDQRQKAEAVPPLAITAPASRGSVGLLPIPKTISDRTIIDFAENSISNTALEIGGPFGWHAMQRAVRRDFTPQAYQRYRAFLRDARVSNRPHSLKIGASLPFDAPVTVRRKPYYWQVIFPLQVTVGRGVTGSFVTHTYETTVRVVWRKMPPGAGSSIGDNGYPAALAIGSFALSPHLILPTAGGPS
ncbi:hypothetical protein F6A13_11875 [Acidithiobacillus sp. 'AMD consortium']|uniref:hypothetical protein n=1 Tax=Acidithiobacillus sp. 'AMD consortium' TaxID=2614801 RepID=UPI00124C954F|nr:hypothetical protein [Acidithiobacillus sp. 'AMD consortium']QFG79233.1 hypothetical protein F6A13_11875 [Acidithiobacillus sp. 'AMD consortium']